MEFVPELRRLYRFTAGRYPGNAVCIALPNDEWGCAFYLGLKEKFGDPRFVVQAYDQTCPYLPPEPLDEMLPDDISVRQYADTADLVSGRPMHYAVDSWFFTDTGEKADYFKSRFTPDCETNWALQKWLVARQ